MWKRVISICVILLLAVAFIGSSTSAKAAAPHYKGFKHVSTKVHNVSVAEQKEQAITKAIGESIVGFGIGFGGYTAAGVVTGIGLDKTIKAIINPKIPHPLRVYDYTYHKTHLSAGETMSYYGFSLIVVKDLTTGKIAKSHRVTIQKGT